MTTKIIPANSSNGVYYGPSAANDTIVNHYTILSPTTNPGSRYGDNAVDLYEANNLTLLNTGTINSRYAIARQLGWLVSDSKDGRSPRVGKMT